MLTVLEGPDCSGKTTALSHFPDSNHEHFGPPGPNGAWADYVAELNRQWKVRHVLNTVYDRFVYGELIYGPLLRPHLIKDFTRAHVRMLERVMLSMQGVLVGVISDWEATETLWLERKNAGKELITDSSRFKTSYLDWERLLVNQIELDGHLPTIFYDWRLTKYNEKNPLLARIAAARPPVNHGTGIGMWQEGVTLLIGDQANPNVASNTAWPFVAPSGSSLWLSQQLESIFYPEQKLYWVNAYDVRGKELNPGEVDSLRPAHIYTLGTNAAHWADKHAVRHTNVPHPSYWKRFHSDQKYPLLSFLLEDLHVQGALSLGEK